ncbi:MAG: D-alanyl-lipoteichoic acid biosynthesis protein DltD [Nitrospirota bacterium]
MERARGRQGMPHLFSGLIAASLIAAVLVGTRTVAVHLEQATILSTSPELFSLKNQGLAFQRAAARAAYVLPFYGSSELTAVRVPERAHIFFRTAPTGFQVSPVGAGGMNSLIMLQKIAALGSDLRDKKVAISLSPGWLLTPGAWWSEWYRGNFSMMAASEMAFGTALNLELKRDIASRMLKFPSTLKNSPFLEFALRLLASDRWLDRVLFYVIWPVGKAQTTMLELQDHFAALNYISHKLKPGLPRHLETLDWSKLIANVDGTTTIDAEKVPAASSLNGQTTRGPNDGTFRSDMNASPGWINLELLLRTLASVHARPLVLSMPIPGDLYDQRGVSRSAREDYYVKLRTLVQSYHFPLVEFKGHDEDPAFLYLQKSHLTAKGWIFYNRALDDFFHGRLPRD